MRTVQNSFRITVRRHVRARTERLYAAGTHVRFWNVHPNNSKWATTVVCTVRKLHRLSQRAVMAERTIRCVFEIFTTGFTVILAKFMKFRVIARCLIELFHNFGIFPIVLVE